MERLPGGPRLQHLTARHGLPQDIVNAIVQDRVGFMWFGTEEGLARFDGLRFEVFRPDPTTPGSLSDEAVTSLLVDSSGALWAGTWGGGLNRFDPASETFTHLRAGGDGPRRLLDDRVLSLFEDRAGVLWVGTSRGLNRVDRASLEVTAIAPPPASPPASALPVWAVTEDLFENLWIGTGAGLLRLDRPSRRFLPATDSPPVAPPLLSGRIPALGVDRLGRLWAATSQGLRVFDRARGFLVPSALAPAFAALDSARGTVIMTDHDGILTIGTEGEGVFRLDLANGHLARLAHDPTKMASLGHDDVHALYEDHSGVLWIGTHGAGLSKLDLKPVKFTNLTYDFRDPGSLSQGRVWGMLEDRHGVLWIGTDSGIDRLDPGSSGFSHLRHDPRAPRSLPSGVVRRLAETTDSVWAAVGAQWLVRLTPDGTPGRVFNLATDQPSLAGEDAVLALAPAASGGLWIGTGRGLLRFDPTQGTATPIRCDAAGLREEPVTAILTDSRGTLWLGTDGGGLCRCDQSGANCRRFRADPTRRDALSHDRIWAIHEDPIGRVWIGTANGLNLFDPGSGGFGRFHAQEGFPSDSVYGLLSDADSRLWLSTHRGVTRFEPASGAFRTFTPADGLQANLANPGSCLRLRDGTLLLGGFTGLTAFDPRRVVDNPNVPRIVIRSFARPDQQPPLRVSLPESGAIHLAYNHNFFGIGFAALDYTDPARNRYRYRLDGFDTDWIEVAAQAPATYTNVPPGRYLFRVQGSNNDGVWNQAGAALPIVIAPPVWRTWWFQVAAAVALAMATILWYRARIRRLEQERRTLERLVGERTSELAASRDLLAEHRDQLQQINEIVKAINAPHNFVELLTSLLGQMQIIRGVDKAAALIRDRETQMFRFRASWGWPMEDLEYVEMTAEEAQTRYEREAEEIYPDIFVARNNGHNTGEQKFRTRSDWCSMLIMRIRVGERVEGYLVLDSLRDDDAFAERDVLLLESLREHILSAFLKAQMLAELQALNAKKNEFLGMAAHDLRGPLGLIGAWTSLVIRHIQRGTLQPERALRDLGRVVTVAEQMNRMVSEMLDLSAIESGKLRLQPESLSLQGIIEECEQLFGRLAAEKGIALTIVRNGHPALAMADHDRVTEVLSNLISNALKFTPSGGVVRVWCDESPGEVVAHVEDSGPGLSEDDLKVVFRRFGKLSARPTGGEPSTGLGLAIVRKIVEMHGGRVWATSTPGGGAHFSFSLPCPP